jgi:hypothetical protein
MLDIQAGRDICSVSDALFPCQTSLIAQNESQSYKFVPFRAAREIYSGRIAQCAIYLLLAKSLDATH